MKFLDISHDTQNHYTLEEGEKRVFFLWNRDGEITFDLTGRDAQAHIFAFFSLNQETKKSLNIIQKHQSPNTVSHVTVKSVLHDKTECAYEGTIHIAKEASLSDASQESRTLLLSTEARSTAKPMLEILQNDVRCHHAATVSPLNQETLFFAKSRGLSEAQAADLLVNGFFDASIEKMSTLLSFQEQEKMIALVGKYRT